MKRFLLGFLGLIVVLLAVLAIRAAMLESKQPVAGQPAAIEVDLEAIASRFSQALTFMTVSHQKEEDRQPEVFLAFHDFLEASFPAVHATLTRETVNELSLLYKWQGREPQLEPVLLMGHMDVVPVIPGTEEDWQHPPFSGMIADGEIWGRGALDDKASVMAILEAIEQLTTAGFQPRRTIYLAFGHDEEVGGPEGARQIADALFARGIDSFAMILDEGGFIGEGLSSVLDGKVAVIGVAEKGFVSLELVVAADGGHSSTPPNHTALGILSKAVTRLEEITITPYLVIGGTDAKYYSGRSDSVFRFLPVSSGPDVLEKVHGTNERISLESLELAFRYFVQLISSTDELL